MAIFGTQFTGNLAPNQSRTWFTHSWNPNWNVAWMCVPTSPVVDGPAQIEWTVSNTRQGSNFVKWFITARNLTTSNLDFQARYAILNA
ncbi:hypothetical protein [Sphingomonas azotifigens]|uniref:hypothetical protein n=1 Tax=Sphingomonas azotifigens TaxID=330920 RepID=UPI0009FEAF25|nr:hypothetical protein [Sphingomonas azotifigens]